MKKNNLLSTKNICSFAILGTILFAYIKLPVFTFNYAKTLYNAHQYQKALPYFDISLKLEPNNLDAYYYYAKNLDSMKLTYDVQKRLFELSNTSKSGAAATIANKKITNFRYYVLTKTGGNYIQQVPYQDEILHWNPAAFPLKVYIQSNSNLPSYYEQSVKNAFGAWSYATKNYLKFEFVQTPQDAEIDFRFTQKNTTNCKGENCKYILAYTEHEVSGKTLKKSNIRFSDTDFYNKPFSNQDVYLTSMHEIGHALGITGHSFFENNLMYPSKIEDRSIHARNLSRGITMEDLNTLNLLYNFKPDITNKAYSKDKQTNLLYPPIILGNKTEINNKKIEQAKHYIKNAPGLTVGYVDLAAAYYELGNYQECINNLYKALLLSNTEKEKYDILYNMTITYFEGRDYNNAINYAQMAENIKKTVEIQSLSAYSKFKLGNKAFGIKELETLYKQNPNNLDNAQYLIRALVEQKEYLKAGSLIKEVKKANLGARNDPRMQQFGLLNNIFN